MRNMKVCLLTKTASTSNDAFRSSQIRGLATSLVTGDHGGPIYGCAHLRQLRAWSLRWPPRFAHEHDRRGKRERLLQHTTQLQHSSLASFQLLQTTINGCVKLDSHRSCKNTVRRRSASKDHIAGLSCDLFRRESSHRLDRHRCRKFNLNNAIGPGKTIGSHTNSHYDRAVTSLASQLQHMRNVWLRSDNPTRRHQDSLSRLFNSCQMTDASRSAATSWAAAPSPLNT